jgi:addiction module HigA family antidote
MMDNKMRPIHPGEHLREELAELNLSARAFANALDVPVNRVTAILNGRRAVTADTALRLARYFGTTPEFWLNLQTAYELRRTWKRVGKVIERKVAPHAA